MSIFTMKSNVTRLAETITFLDNNRQKIGLSQNTILDVKRKGEQQGWGKYLTLGHRDDWGSDFSLGRGRLFVKAPQTADREALRALLLIYLHVGAPTGVIRQIRDIAALWQSRTPIIDIYIDQMRWLLSNYSLTEEQRRLQAAAAALLAADTHARLNPQPWLFGDPLNKCPDTCYSAAFYFSFLGGVFSHMRLQQSGRDSCLNTPVKIREMLSLPEQVPLEDPKNLASHPRILPPGTLVMMWTKGGALYNHMVISVGETPNGLETLYVSVHTSLKKGSATIPQLLQQNFTYAREDAARYTVNGWLLSHSSLIFVGDFNNDKNFERFVTIAAADHPKWLDQPAWLR